MTKEVKRLILSRAERILPYLADFLSHENSACHLKGSAYRFGYLLVRGPREYLQAFQHGELHIDAEAVEEVYWELRGEMPGPHGLMPDERIILRDHRVAVDEHLSRHQRPGSVVAISERRAISLLR